MIRLINFALLAIVLVSTHYALIAFGDGFYSLSLNNWKWLFAYSRINSGPPTWFLAIVGTAIVVWLFSTLSVQIFLSRVRSSKVHGEYEADELHGSAHFATAEEVKKADIWKDTGVVVGGWPTATGVRPLRDEGPDHILLVGGPRSGKGVGPILSTLLTWEGSVVTNDIRGEACGKTSGWHKQRGAKVLRYAPASIEGSVCWNPLAEIRLGTKYEISDAQNTGIMLIDPDGTGLKDFWMKSGFAWLASTILHVLHKVRIEENRIASLADVSHYLSSPDGEFETMLKDMIAFEHGCETINKFIRASASEMLAAAHPERSGVHSSAKTELMLYRDPIIAENTSRSDFCIEELQNGETPVALFLVIPPNDLDRLRPLLRIFWNLLLRRLMQSYDAKGDSTYKRQLLLMFDEFTSVKKLDIFEQSMAYMGGYGIKAFLVVQDFMQLERTYGRENSILALCKVKLAYAASDTKTAQILSDLSGTATGVYEKHEKNGKAMQIVGNNISERLETVKRPLLTPDECMRLKPAIKNKGGNKILVPGEMLTFVTGHAPIRGLQPLYFKNKDLDARSKLPPVTGSEAHTNQRNTPPEAPMSSTTQNSREDALRAFSSQEFTVDIEEVSNV